MPTKTFSEVRSTSTAPILTSTQSSSLANSYPEDMGRALAAPFATMTADGDNVEIKKAFARAGLK